MNKNLIFKISDLLEQSTGTSEQYSFDIPVEFPEISARSNLKGKIDIMRMEKGLNVVVSGATILADAKCEKCLKNFDENVEIPAAERQFYINRPSRVDDPLDLFLIDKQNMTIDVNEMIRQEIILHFPINSVCSTHCKGICAYCGTDKNKKACLCTEEEPEENKPLSALKDLLKN